MKSGLLTKAAKVMSKRQKAHARSTERSFSWSDDYCAQDRRALQREEDEAGGAVGGDEGHGRDAVDDEEKQEGRDGKGEHQPRDDP